MFDTIIWATGLIYALGKDAWSYVKENNNKPIEYKEVKRTVEFDHLKKIWHTRLLGRKRI